MTFGGISALGFPRPQQGWGEWDASFPNKAILPAA